MKTICFFVISTVFYSWTKAQPSFDADFISKHNQQASIEMPEVQELAHVIFAITETGKLDSNMINHESLYYKEVLAYFLPYKDEAVVKSINKDLKGGIFYGSRYSRLNMDAVGFYFDGDEIIKDTHYPQLNWDNKNYIEPYIQELEAFAKKTNFRKFFADHKPYCDTLMAEAKRQMPIEKVWKWLEDRFPNRYNSYRIAFSPLANGWQSTNNFEDNGFKQCVMFICGPYENSKLSKPLQEAFMTKVVFTEIDHNYVNPITAQYKNQVKEIFSDRKKWTGGNDSKNYGTSEMVFNEYMTHAVYLLYAYDNFSSEDFERISKSTVMQMTQSRGFIKFKEFSESLLLIYKDRKQSQLISELYPAMLDGLNKK